MVQVEPLSQTGHDGAEVSHLTQRLKMDRAVKAGKGLVVWSGGRERECQVIPLAEKEASKDMMRINK